MSTRTTPAFQPSRWLALGVLALAALGAGCNKAPNNPPPASTTTPSGSSTAPMAPASAASR